MTTKYRGEFYNFRAELGAVVPPKINEPFRAKN